jgi:hypothetical protein
MTTTVPVPIVAPRLTTKAAVAPRRVATPEVVAIWKDKTPVLAGTMCRIAASISKETDAFFVVFSNKISVLS